MTAINFLYLSSAINELPAITHKFFEQLTEASGWSFTLLMGGPSPEQAGKIISAAHHTGITHLGHDFGAAFRGFQDEIVAPYQGFLRQVYRMFIHPISFKHKLIMIYHLAAEIRRQRALQVLPSAVDAMPYVESTPEVMPAVPTGLIAFDLNRPDIGDGADAVHDKELEEIGDVDDGALEDDPFRSLLSYHTQPRELEVISVDEVLAEDSSKHTPQRDMRTMSTRTSPNPFVVPESADSTATLPHPTRPPPRGVQVISKSLTVSTQSAAARERFAALQHGRDRVLAAKAKKVDGTAPSTPSPSYSGQPPLTTPPAHVRQPLHIRLLEELAMDEADKALAAEDMALLLAQPDLTPGEARARKHEELAKAVERRDIAKEAADAEGRAEKDGALSRLIASRAAKVQRKATATDIAVQEQATTDEQAATTDEQMPTDQHALTDDTETKAAAALAAPKMTLVPQAAITLAAQRKLTAEGAILKALEKKARTQEAAKLAAQAKAVEVAAAKAKDAAAEIAAQALVEDAPEPPQTQTRRELADAKRVAKAEAAAEEQTRVKERQIAKDAAYTQAMQDNNAGHLIANPFSLPDDAPFWLTELVNYLPDNDLGSEWRGCIQAFVTLYDAMGCIDMVSHARNCMTWPCLPLNYRLNVSELPIGPHKSASGLKPHAK